MAEIVKHRLTKLERGERMLGFALLAPAFALLALIIVYPVGHLIYDSFREINQGTRPGERRFIGFLNYSDAFADSRFWEALGNTALYAGITVPDALVIGLGLALLANKPFTIKWPVRLGLLLPWALPLVFVGLIFRWFFDSDLGIVNDIMVATGIGRLQWLSSPNLAFAAICIAIVWKTSSFVALILLAGLQTIPKSLYEAADVDGASTWQQFKEITLPMLMPAMVVAMIFRTITAIQTFDIPYAMTRGGPGTSTVSIAMFIEQNTVEFLDRGYGSALAVIMFIISMVATSFYLRHTQRDKGDRKPV